MRGDLLAQDAPFPTYYPLALLPLPASSSSSGRPSTIPPGLWPEIARRAQRESLRDLGTAYGVSYETIRRILKRYEAVRGPGTAA